MDDQDTERTSSPLHVKRDPVAATEPAKACPSCGSEMPAEAVLCVQCGYDFRSGAVHKTAKHIPYALGVILAVVVSVVITAVAIVVLLNVFRSDDPSPPPTTTPVDPAPPQPAHVAVPADVAPEPAERVETPPAPEPEPIDPSEAVDPPLEEEIDDEDAIQDEADPRQQEEELRRSLRDALDERVPPRRIGDTVELRRLNGFVHRGELVAIRDGVALVVDGEIRERVPLQELDRDSRILVDEEFRERLVNSRLRGMLRNRE